MKGRTIASVAALAGLLMADPFSWVGRKETAKGADNAAGYSLSTYGPQAAEAHGHFFVRGRVIVRQPDFVFSACIGCFPYTYQPWPLWRVPVYDTVYASPSPNAAGYANSAETARRETDAYQRGATDATNSWLRQENQQLRRQLEARAAPQPAEPLKPAAVPPTPPNVVVPMPATGREAAITGREAAIDKIAVALVDKRGFNGRRDGELPRFAMPSYSRRPNESDVTCGVAGIMVVGTKYFVLDAEPRDPGCPERNTAVIQGAQKQGVDVTGFVYKLSSEKTPEAWLRDLGLR